jgi:hypothetical protein
MKRTVKITLTEEMLGTKAANKDVFADFIASKAPDGDKRKEELDTAEHREEAGTTVFHQQDGKHGLWDYQIKGFFKDACGALRNADGTLSSKVVAYKSRIDQIIFVGPRFIPVELSGPIGICERPLRCDTAQGPRVSVARSETIPAGSSFTVEITCLAKKVGKADSAVDADALIDEWLNYGALRGLGQWRNSGKGRFTWENV